jgi:hypothetical protein
MTKELLHLPHDFLHSLAEFFLNSAMRNPTNRHIPRAISFIVELNPDSFLDLIHPGIPLSVLVGIFPDRFTKLKQPLVDNLKSRSLECLKGANPTAMEYESSCIVLSHLLISEQIQPGEVEDAISLEMFERSINLPALMSLPVKFGFVQTLFTKSADNLIEADRKYVQPLIIYFARGEGYAAELFDLLSRELNPQSECLSVAIEVLRDVGSSFLKTPSMFCSRARLRSAPGGTGSQGFGSC